MPTTIVRNPYTGLPDVTGGGGGTPGGATTQVQFNNAGVFGADALFTWDNTNKRLAVGVSTPTAGLHVVSQAAGTIGAIFRAAAAQTANITEWQDTAGTGLVRVTAAGTFVVPYRATGVERYVISAFANFSRQFGLFIQASGNEGGFKADSQFTLKATAISCQTVSATTSIAAINTTASWISAVSVGHLFFGNVGHVNYSRGAFVIGSSANSSDTTTVRLELNGPIFNPNNSLEIRRGANAQRLNIYGTFTDASNYRRAFISSTVGGAFTLGVEGLGTGASGNTLTLASYSPASMADASAANDTIYYSTTASRLVYKDSAGTVNNLY